jgi:hypothetical protein
MLDVGQRRVRALGANGLQTFFRPFAELLERGTRGKTRGRIGHGDLVSMLPVSARRAERRSEDVGTVDARRAQPFPRTGCVLVRRRSLPSLPGSGKWQGVACAIGNSGEHVDSLQSVGGGVVDAIPRITC